MKNLLLTFILINTTFLVNSIQIETPPNGVSIHMLDNGIKVLLIENPALPMVGINTVVKVGSAYETYASSGMSHMLEHLLFNGTSQMNQKQLYAMSDKIGGYNNANTSDFYTNYMMVTPADKIQTGMKIQAGMLFDSIIPVSKFEKEKGIVLEEIAKSLANPRELISRGVRHKLYAGHALSLPTLGTYETIKGMDRDDLVYFYRSNYVPNNMEISVIGNFKSEEMLGLLTEIYGKQAPGNVQRSQFEDWSIGFDASHLKTIQNGVDYMFHPGEEIIIQNFYPITKQSDDFYTLLNDVLDKSSEAIQKALQKQFPQNIKSIDFQVHNQPVAHFLQANITLNNGEKMTEIAQTFDQLLKQQELKLTNSYLKNQSIKAQSAFLKQIEKPHMFGIYNADTIAKHGVNSIIEQFSGTGIIKAGAEINQYKITSQPMILVQYPDFKNTKEDTQKIFTKLFENGVNKPTVIAKQNSGSELLAIHYLFKYKHKLESNKAKDAAVMWHDVFGKRMMSDKIQSQISDYGLSFTVNDIPYLPMDDIYLSPTFGYIRVEGLATDIKAVIDFLNQQMLDFIPTEAEFQKALKKYVNAPSMEHNNASKELMSKHIDKLVFKNKNNDAIESPDYTSFLAFGKKYFAPNNMVISVVSKENVNQINQYFDGFSQNLEPQFSGLAHIDEYKIPNKAHNITENIKGEQAHLFYGFIKKIEAGDKAALSILSLMLRDDIIFNLREKQGLAYRMSAGININSNKALIYIKIPTLPKNVEVIDNQFKTLITTKFAQDLDQDEVEKTINKYLGKMMFRRLSSINQAYYLAHSYYFDGNISQDEIDLKDLSKVTLNDVKRVAKKYLKNTNSIKIIIK